MKYFRKNMILAASICLLVSGCQTTQQQHPTSERSIIPAINSLYKNCQTRFSNGDFEKVVKPFTDLLNDPNIDDHIKSSKLINSRYQLASLKKLTTFDSTQREKFCDCNAITYYSHLSDNELDVVNKVAYGRALSEIDIVSLSQANTKYMGNAVISCSPTVQLLASEEKISLEEKSDIGANLVIHGELDKAIRLLHSAAAMGDYRARMNLGFAYIMYETKSIYYNPFKAHYWFQIAKLSGAREMDKLMKDYPIRKEKADIAKILAKEWFYRQ